MKPERIAQIRAGVLLVAANAVTAAVAFGVDLTTEQATQATSLISSVVILAFLFWPQSPLPPSK